MCVAKIETLLATPELFEAKANIHLRINKKMHSPYNWDRLKFGWKFGSVWDGLSISNRSIGFPYTSVVFITDHDIVIQTEKLVLEGKHDEAVKLVFDCV